MTTYNWQELKDRATQGGPSALLPLGDYVVRVKQANAKKTNDGSKDMIVAQFEIIAGPQAGQTLWNNFTLSPENTNALGFFFQHMAALGIPDTAWAQQPDVATLAQWVVHYQKPVLVTVGHRAYQGQLRNDITSIREYGQGAPAPAPAPVPAAAPAPPPMAAPPAPPVAATPPAPPAGPPAAPPAPPAPVPQPVAAPAAPPAAPYAPQAPAAPAAYAPAPPAPPAPQAGVPAVPAAPPAAPAPAYAPVAAPPTPPAPPAPPSDTPF